MSRFLEEIESISSQFAGLEFESQVSDKALAKILAEERRNAKLKEKIRIIRASGYKKEN